MKNLVIVESPGKVKSIEKYLGKDYKVLSSYGHIRDLSKKEIDLSNGENFSPDYEIPADKKDLVKKLKSAVKEADMVWLASDEDREGEAIAWHLYEVLGLKPENTKRIVFHEITKPALLNAIANPRDIDIDLVNAQQARRVLDRIVGFELSPVLWKKIKPALSAGRVQSVALRLICEREKEIQDFVAEPFFRITALMKDLKNGAEFKAEIPSRFETEEAAMKVMEVCAEIQRNQMQLESPLANEGFRVADVQVKPSKRSPLPPFTTSTLQQEASRRLGMSVSQTMMAAQKLYEAGHITYMRTDSLNLSELAIKDISALITAQYGEDTLHVRHYHTNSKGAQEAHEAIRPTYMDKTAVSGTSSEQKLYDLIRRRAIASQMADAVVEKTTIEISTPKLEYNFRAEGEVIKYEGFLKVWQPEASKRDEVLPPLKEGDAVVAQEITASERFTQAPPRYTDGTYTKKMEELGIGRPSTYATILTTIINRDYVKRGDKEGEPRQYDVIHLADGKIKKTTLTENTGSEKGKLVPTDVGMIVNDFLTEHFPEILDYNFTAKVEGKFDEIAQGQLGWKNEIFDFYGGFHPAIEAINELKLEHKVGERLLGTDPKSGRPVSVKIGRFGPVVQIGDAADEEKPLFASLKKDQSIATITLEEALKLFELPRTLGDFEGKTVVAAVGRFGPYIRHNGVFVSIPKGTVRPEDITLDEAIVLIEAKRAKDAAAIIKTYDEMPGLQVLNGRWGPYLAYKPEGAKKATNYKIPKGTDAASLTFEEAQKLMHNS